MLGIDLCSIKKIDHLLKTYQGRFLDRVFTEVEQAYIKKRAYAPKTMAGLYAAKEAMAKALGTGIGPVSFKDLEVVHLPYPQGRSKGKIFHLSISHEGDYAMALAILDDQGTKLDPLKSFQVFFTPRPLDAHKGSVGKLGLLAGKRGMLGAYQFAGLAAYRAGAGMVYGYVPKEDLNVFSLALPEAVLRPREEGVTKDLDHLDSLIIGPGLGVGDRAIKEALNIKIKKVIDADGLSYLSKLDQVPGLQGAILSPHEEEARRLFHAPGASRDVLIRLARDFAQAHQCVLVLKGPKTYVTDGKREVFNTTGNPSMAVGGMGDVLSGILGYYLTQTADPFLAASFSVYLHGLAGDLADKDLGQGLLARDIIEKIPQARKLIKSCFNKTYFG